MILNVIGILVVVVQYFLNLFIASVKTQIIRQELLSQVQILDVRELNEFEGPLGRIPDAKLIPLNQLVSRFEELDFSIPIVAVCRSGARSAQAVMHLKRLGFTKLANLSGGMLRWNVGGYPVLGNTDRTVFER